MGNFKKFERIFTILAHIIPLIHFTKNVKFAVKNGKNAFRFVKVIHGRLGPFPDTV